MLNRTGSRRPRMAEQRTIAQQAAVTATTEPAPPPVTESVHYPDSDGRFLPENPLQARAIINVRSALTQHFDQVDNVVLEGDMFVYYERGNPAASIAPDVFVVLEHDLGDRPVYKFWEEGKPPDFALEVISPSSEVRNAEEKRTLYARLGIGEYFLFQPEPRRRGRRLVGYRLRGQAYEELPLERGGAVHSTALGVSLRVEGTNLRVRSLETGEDYLWVEEQHRALEAAKSVAESEAEARRRAEAIAESEAEARRRAEARTAELEALLLQRGQNGRHGQ